MRILVLGAYESCNLGDGVICQCVADRLRKHYPDAEICIRDLVRRDRHSPRKEPSPDALRSRWVHELARGYASRLGWDKVLAFETGKTAKYADYIDEIGSQPWDAVVFAGGQLLMDRYALLMERYMGHFRARKIPVLFNACGTGPMDSRAVKQRLKQVLCSENVKFISCRDHVDRVNRDYLEGKQAFFAADPALWTGEVYGIQKDPASNTVGLGVMYPWGMDVGRVLRFWRKLIRELDRKAIRWEIFTNGDPADIAFAKMILEGQRTERIARRDVDPEGLVATVSRYESIISFRLHSHIIACALDIPTVAMVWDQKLPVFFEKIGYHGRCLTVKASPEAVLGALERARQEGYDRGQIRAMAEESTGLLLNAMEGCL